MLMIIPVMGEPSNQFPNKDPQESKPVSQISLHNKLLPFSVDYQYCQTIWIKRISCCRKPNIELPFCWHYGMTTVLLRKLNNVNKYLFRLVKRRLPEGMRKNEKAGSNAALFKV